MQTDNQKETSMKDKGNVASTPELESRSKQRVDKLECHYSMMFRVMWLSTAIWIIIGIANYVSIPERTTDSQLHGGVSA